MVVSFLTAFYFEVVHAHLGSGLEISATWRLVIGVALTTVAWLAVTWLTPPSDSATLQRFYDRIRPLGKGWQRVVRVEEGRPTTSGTAAMAAVFFGCLAVYSALFATGYLIYGRTLLGLFLAGVAGASSIALIRIMPRCGLLEDNS